MLIADDVYLLESLGESYSRCRFGTGRSRTCAQLLAVCHSIAFERGGHRPAPLVLARLARYLLNCPRTAPAGKTVLWTLT